jgi:two-component system LytT family response regulator
MTIENNSRLNVIIVDDEKTACYNLKNIISNFVDSSINISGIAHDTAEAEFLINANPPDAVFLDIEMPDEDAFHFIERISPFNYEIIFVTAYDAYAIKALKLNALDYILKPLSITEVTNAIHKLKEKCNYKNNVYNNNVSYSNVSRQINNNVAISKITLKDNNAIEIVDFKDVVFVEAKGSYSKIVFTKINIEKDIIMSHPVSEYEELFPSELFYRIHKSYLINCNHIDKVLKDETPFVIMKNKNKLPVSRRRFPTLLNFLKRNNFYYG